MPATSITAVERQADLLEQATTHGSARVIVRLSMPMAPQGQSDLERRAILSTAQRGVLSRLGLAEGRDRSGEPVKLFGLMPGLALEVDVIDLMDLLADPTVVDVVEDVAYPPALIESVPLIGAVGGTFGGYSGAGQAIAILDTGVDKDHPFLAGKVVSEACYSSNAPAYGASSLCPGGVTASTAPSSALNCSMSVDGCFHGTHVAGIAAGKGSSFSGVARDAQIIAVQVFSLFPSSYCGLAPCVLAFTSDIILGLERIHALRATHAIAAANLSLGGGRFTGYCDGDPTKPAIDALHAAGIATVIASGNDGFADATGAPGCVSTAVTVGSTTKSDSVSSFSNSASFLDLLAPGSSIYSSIPGGTYGYASGTSMATPHVAGAWAVLKSAKPAAGVEEVLAALQSSGEPVLDLRNNLSKPRIQVAEAVSALTSVSEPIPEAPSGLTATALSTSQVNLTWVDNSTNESGFRIER
ncbi:MAG: S8 family serine peptidase, partial [Chromatiaceae bacterium]|nr:S8 family serine peptidase [Chromatiaceae bacterium]